MLPSLLVKSFVNPKRGSRERAAILRAVDLQPKVDFIGSYGSEKYYRVNGRHGHRYCVVVWQNDLTEEWEVKCDCEASYVPHSPTPCFHAAAVLIQEGEEDAKPHGTRGEKAPATNHDRRPQQTKVKG